MTEPDFVFTTKSTVEEPRTIRNQVPWIGVTIRILKPGHPLRGSLAVIKDVLTNQPTLSGLQLKVQMCQYNPANPFSTCDLDYDDVAENT